MLQWKEYSVSQIADLVKDTFKPNKDENLPFIGLEHIEEQKLRLNSVGSSSDVASNKYYFQANDVLFGKLRPYFRKVVKPNFNGICSTDIWVLRSKKGFDQNFLFYFIANKDFVDLANSADTGTRMPRAEWDFVKETMWQIPPEPEQKQIASVLTCLDDKIDLLYRNNISLEELAQTVFRQWFLEEKNDWEDVPLKALANHIKTSINPLKQPDKVFRHYSIPAFDEGKEPQVTLGFQIKSNKYQIKNNTVLISKLNPRFPRVWLILNEVSGDDSICSTEFQVVEPKDKKHLGYIFCFLKSYLVSTELAQAAGGTSGSHQRVAPDDIFNLTILIPEERRLKQFNDITNPFWEKMSLNRKEIQKLQTLRDTLLPKLMSGEARVTM